MSDTMRSLSALQTLLADNSAGDISAQDVRDFLVSAYAPQGVNGFRLTLTTAAPVTTADVTGATTVYWTPYLHNRVGVYDGTSWKQYTSAELSLALGTLTSGANYDVFLYDNSGTLTLKLGPAWASDTSRGTGAGTTELDTQDGVYVNKVSITSGPGAKAGILLGTLRTTSTTATEDSAAKRFLWNAYGRVVKGVRVFDATSSWTYNSATIRQARAQAANQVEAVAGLAVSALRLAAGCCGSSALATAFQVGIGEDSTTALAAEAGANGLGAIGPSGSTFFGTSQCFLSKTVPLGYHAYVWLENCGAANTVTFFGSSTANLRQSGLEGDYEC